MVLIHIARFFSRLQDELVVEDNDFLHLLITRGKRHDYSGYMDLLLASEQLLSV